MTRPRLLDLYCGAGGAAMGYWRAGFDVVGVDIVEQPHYPFPFVQADASTYPLDGFDVIHASPPCQDHTTIMRAEPHGTGWMLPATIDRLRAHGAPFVVENVESARRLMPGAVRICARGLGVDALGRLRRHRLFLVEPFLIMVPPCACARSLSTVGVYGDLQANDRRARGKTSTVPTMRASVTTARLLMDCPWMTARELTQAIPPAYTELIGEQLRAALP